MKTKNLTVILLLFMWSFAVCKTYACDKDPVAKLYPTSQYKEKDDEAIFDGHYSTDLDGPKGSNHLKEGIKEFYWDFDDGHNYTETWDHCPDFDGWTGWTKHSYTVLGDKTVTMRVTDNDKAEGGAKDRSAEKTCVVHVIQKPYRLIGSGPYFYYEDAWTYIEYINYQIKDKFGDNVTKDGFGQDWWWQESLTQGERYNTDMPLPTPEETNGTITSSGQLTDYLQLPKTYFVGKTAWSIVHQKLYITGNATGSYWVRDNDIKYESEYSEFTGATYYDIEVTKTGEP